MTIDKKYIDQFASVTIKAALAASYLIGKKDKIAADKAATDSMRTELNKINMNGKVVIGEGELDEAPMLYIGEKVGNNKGIEIDIAVDPLEGTNFIAKNLPNALTVLAATEKGNLLNAPDMYMEKIAIGPGFKKNLIDLDKGVEKNIHDLSKAKNTTPENLTACLLKRDRHNSIIQKLNSMKVKIKYIDDGDVMGVLSVSDPLSKIDIYMGIGGAPEGVLAAAALSCLDCQMQSRLVFNSEVEKDKAKKLGIKDLNMKYNIEQMVKGDVIFCATGVTCGELLSGIENYDNYFISETLVLHKSSKTNMKVKNKTKK